MKITEAQAGKLAGLWGIELTTEVAAFVPRPALEYLVHELAHAATLRYKVPKSSYFLATTIASLPGARQDLNEAMTCAVELAVCKVLGFPDFTEGLITAAAENLKYEKPETKRATGRVSGFWALTMNDREVWLANKVAAYRTQKCAAKYTKVVLDWLRQGMVALEA